jgi:membrane protein YdbS with pleckstrin-like domain
MTKPQHWFYLVIGIVVFIYFSNLGYSYYLTPIEERFFHPSHEILKPSGILAHGLGIIGSLMMLVGVALYIVRKRVKAFSRLGAVKNWLELHIFLCSVGPVLVLFHTAFKFGGIVALSFWCMVAVVISGIIGRFIYVQIPRSIRGNEYTMEELKILNQSFGEKLKNEFNLNDSLLNKLEYFVSIKIYKSPNLFSIIPLTIKDHFVNKKILNELKSELRREKLSEKSLKQIISICNSKLVLSRKISLLNSVNEMFRYWHIIHLPFAIVMLLIMVIHVGVTVAFGYRWIF